MANPSSIVFCYASEHRNTAVLCGTIPTSTCMEVHYRKEEMHSNGAVVRFIAESRVIYLKLPHSPVYSSRHRGQLDQQIHSREGQERKIHNGRRRCIFRPIDVLLVSF